MVKCLEVEVTRVRRRAIDCARRIIRSPCRAYVKTRVRRRGVLLCGRGGARADEVNTPAGMSGPKTLGHDEFQIINYIVHLIIE